MRVRLVLGLLCLVAAPLAAQSDRPNTRQGFWIGFGVGPGSIGEDCSSCDDSRINGGSLYVRMGGTLTQGLLLGGEVEAWATESNGVERTYGSGALVVLWYPRRAGALYLKAGAGGMTYTSRAGTSELEATAGTISLGVGYEIRVRNMFSIVPYLSISASKPVEFTFNGQPVANNDDIKLNLVHLGIGLTWH